MLDRPEKKIIRNSAIKEMLNSSKVENEDKLIEVEMTEKQFDELAEKVSSREKNPKGYERYRGRAGNQKTKAMSYYLSKDLIQALAMKSAREGLDKSAIVRRALKKELKAELKELSEEKGLNRDEL